MKTILSIKPWGLINRRDKADQGDMMQVLMRENFLVIGTGEEKYIKKCPGTDRLSVNDVGGSYVSGYRYYSKGGFRKTFSFNAGTLYFIDDSGNETALLSTFLPIAIPCFEEMRVSGNDNLYFSEGNNTGMYSYDGNAANQFNKESAVTLNFVRMISFLDRMWGFEEDSDIVYGSVNLNPVNYTDATDAFAISIGAKRGSKLQNFFILNETLYFIKNDFEFYSFQGTLSSTQLQSYQISIGGDFSKDLVSIINKDRMDQVRAVFHNHTYRCSFVENGQTQNNLEWCLDLTNQTDYITRDNNVSCYIPWDRIPDQQQLITGRSDVGRLMFQYRGLNYDNQATSPTMPLNLLTKFVGLKQPRNMRIKKAWLNAVVLGAYPIQINYYMDTRLARSSSQGQYFKIQGETKGLTKQLRINNQRSVTSRAVLSHDGANGQNIAFEINQSISNTDFGFSSIDCQVVTHQLKRNEKVSI